MTITLFLGLIIWLFGGSSAVYAGPSFSAYVQYHNPYTDSYHYLNGITFRLVNRHYATGKKCKTQGFPSDHVWLNDIHGWGDRCEARTFRSGKRVKYDNGYWPSEKERRGLVYFTSHHAYGCNSATLAYGPTTSPRNTLPMELRNCPGKWEVSDGINFTPRPWSGNPGQGVNYPLVGWKKNTNAGARRYKPTFTWVPQCEYCGDNVIQDGETCDDGNSVGGDGCSATCNREPTGTITGPKTLSIGETGTFPVTGADEDGDLSYIKVSLRKQEIPSNSNWTNVATVGCSGNSCSSSPTWTVPTNFSEGTYEMVVNVYDINDFPKCSGNPACNGVGCGGGVWADCDVADNSSPEDEQDIHIFEIVPPAPNIVSVSLPGDCAETQSITMKVVDADGADNISKINVSFVETVSGHSLDFVVDVPSGTVEKNVGNELNIVTSFTKDGDTLDCTIDISPFRDDKEGPDNNDLIDFAFHKEMKLFVQVIDLDGNMSEEKVSTNFIPGATTTVNATFSGLALDGTYQNILYSFSINDYAYLGGYKNEVFCQATDLIEGGNPGLYCPIGGCTSDNSSNCVVISTDPQGNDREYSCNIPLGDPAIYSGRVEISYPGACVNPVSVGYSVPTIFNAWFQTRRGDVYSYGGVSQEMPGPGFPFSSYYCIRDGTERFLLGSEMEGNDSWLGYCSTFGWLSTRPVIKTTMEKEVSGILDIVKNGSKSAFDAIPSIISGTPIYYSAGDVTISKNISNADIDSGALFIVDGGDLTIASAVTELNGFFIVNGGKFIASPGSDPLIVKGGVVAVCADNSCVQLDRDPDAFYNAEFPAELLEYDPRYIVLFRDILGELGEIQFTESGVR